VKKHSFIYELKDNLIQ